MNTDSIGWFEADWTAPGHIRAGTTLRYPGLSEAPYDAFNLALHVEDNPDTVLANRRGLREGLALPAEPCWLEQVHSRIVVNATEAQTVPHADASYANQPGVICVVMTADCLPVLFTNRQGSIVAAAHAGWRGLANGILEETLSQSGLVPEEALAWLGPGIGAEVYEVGEEVKQAFVQQAMHDESAFIAHGSGKFLMDMYCLARQRLQTVGVTDISGGTECTYRQKDSYYSYRRDGVTGRMASLIWIQPQAD